METRKKKFETVAEHRVGGGDPGSGLQQLLPQRSSFRVQGLFAELLFPTARHRFPNPKPKTGASRPQRGAKTLGRKTQRPQSLLLCFRV